MVSEQEKANGDIELKKKKKKERILTPQKKRVSPRFLVVEKELIIFRSITGYVVCKSLPACWLRLLRASPDKHPAPNFSPQNCGETFATGSRRLVKEFGNTSWGLASLNVFFQTIWCIRVKGVLGKASHPEKQTA